MVSFNFDICFLLPFIYCPQNNTQKFTPSDGVLENCCCFCFFFSRFAWWDKCCNLLGRIRMLSYDSVLFDGADIVRNESFVCMTLMQLIYLVRLGAWFEVNWTSCRVQLLFFTWLCSSIARSISCWSVSSDS